MPGAVLHTLVRRLDAAVTAAPGSLHGAVTGALAEATARCDWLADEQQRADAAQYARHVLHADPLGRYTVVALVWNRGQQSPVHAHHTWCGVAVYRGEISETFYAADEGAPVPLRTVRRGAGTLSFDGGGAGVHRIANPDGDVAVSIHVYGINAAEVATGVNRVLG
ncbi:MAG: cysteine dioxygenase family protein [Burkholderiales bacterium]|nr:cysteine dioxygenase family protein [Burkholderiales bacterium]